MFSRKVKVLATTLALLGFAVQAGAESKKYLIKFSSSQAYNMVALSAGKPTLHAFGTGSTVKLFNTNAAITQALDQIEMLVVETEDSQAIESLRNHPAITLVEEEVFHPAPQPMATWGHTPFSLSIKRASVGMPWGITAVKAPEAWAVTKGDNVRVLVLDTGIDMNHEALKSRFEKGRNFTSSNPDDFADAMGHGTHVAGTILADGMDGGLVGVAPEAKLLMGRVCADRGCSSVAIANGINWAITESVDVVNMSLGGMFITEGEMQALRAAEANGVLVVAASGNEGVGRVSYPAAFSSVLAVGATDSNNVRATFSQWGPELAVVAPGVDVLSAVPTGSGRGATVMIDFGKGLSEIASAPMVGSPLRNGEENELVAAGLGKPEDFATVNVNGKFALVSRGEITFKDKVANAIQAGAAGVIIYNNAPGLLQGALTEDGSEAAIPAAMIEQHVGELIMQALNSGSIVVASMSIDATDYASFQGTSMATPHVAGVAALVKGANGNLTPAQIRNVLKDTATPLGPNSRNEYGAGLVNAEAAVVRAAATRTPLLRVAN